jgi:DNA polymerase elongation subunit (family B)
MGMLFDLEQYYPEGSNITIMNTFYQYPVYQDGKKLSDDFIVLVYKDLDTMQNHKIIIFKPDYIFYMIKEGEEIPDYNKLFIERDKVEPITVPFRDLEKKIAEYTNHKDYYDMCIANRDKQGLQKLHTDPSVFFSDVNIEDHYRFRFANTYQNEVCALHKSFFDIEVDGIHSANDFVQMGECPINCISFMDDSLNKIYTLILRDDNNPLIAKFEQEIASKKISTKDIRDFITDSVGGPYYAKKYNLLDVTFEITFFDNEIDLISSLFNIIHTLSPDFVEGWNSSDFDLTYIIERIKVLGYDPADVMCDRSWDIKIVKNYVDMRHKNELPERGDYTFISGTPIFMDQMIQYASRRKAKFGSFNSFKLDDIGLKEAKVHKLDYHHITDSVLKLPYLDFKTFVFYNMMDVVVQHCIELQTQDLEYIFTKCIVNNTIYRKGHRQTIYLINRMAADWYKMGYIIGNNNNRNNPQPMKFKGAIVMNPLNTNDYSKQKINGHPIWVVDNLIDFDFSSLYPSLMLEFNIAPNTQIGKIDIPEQVHSKENPYMEEGYNRGGEFVDNLTCDYTLEFAHRWLGLASYQEMLDDIDEYFTLNSIGPLRELAKKNSPLLPVTSSIVEPITFDYRKYTPENVNKPFPSDITYESIINRSSSS